MVDRIFDMIVDMIEGHREEMIRQMDEVHDTPLFRRSHATMPYCTEYSVLQYQLSAPTITVNQRQSAPTQHSAIRSQLRYLPQRI
jgi:hypothetical protein